MKKLLLVFVAICSLFVIPSCNNEKTKTPTAPVVEKYTITFYTFGLAETPSPITDITYVPANMPKISVEGYEFFGWYYDEVFSKKAFQADILNQDVMLYAKLVKEKTPEATPTVPTETPTPEETPTEEQQPTFDDTNKLDSIRTCEHTFVSLECSKCETEYDPQVYNIFKSNTIIYDNDSSNPYNINLDVYGSDVKVIFYDADIRRDIYPNVTSEQFYSNYRYAKSYEEAYFRTQHNFMSGDITDQQHLTPNGKVMDGSSSVRCTTAIYILDYQGAYLGYTPNSLTNDNHVIWYGGAYISHNDVAAYLFAFGEVPVNSNYDKGSSGRKASVAAWGKYGRANIGGYSNDTVKYPYEPKLCANNGQKYTETDFGTTNEYYTGTRKQTIYNNGSSITRGAARYCFVNNKKSVDERYVFYTSNHYNDFQEYLNYENGFGGIFGYITAGNVYDTTNGTPTQYNTVAAVLKTYQDLLNLK